MKKELYQLSWNLTYLLTAQYACRAATKVLHFCLSLAIFSTVSHVLFMVFISPPTGRLHVFIGLPRLRFPSGVQCSAVLVMDFLSFLITCPIHFQRLLNNIVAILSCLHCLSRSSVDIVFGQKMRRILLIVLVWKSDSCVRSCSVILQHSEPYNRVDSTQLW